ncbi:MAG TPA: YaeQ family protein [Geomonas sp.]|nr:YaeQ family protein [Geomonas sp.]
MALPSTIYRATIELSDVDRGVYETLSATVARHPSETEERMVARLLALALFFEPELVFTKGLSATQEPDIWVLGPDGRAKLWVEVGLPEAERVVKAARHAERVALLAFGGRALSTWDQQQLPKLQGIPNLTVLSVDQSFVANLAASLQRVISWSITISDGIIYLTSRGSASETAINVKVGRLRDF